MILTLNIQGSPSELTQALLALAALDTGANVGFTASTSSAGDPVKVEHSEKEVVPISGEKKGLPKVNSEPAPKQKKAAEPAKEEVDERSDANITLEQDQKDAEEERISLEALRVPFNTLMKTQREELKSLIQDVYNVKSLTEFDSQYKDNATRREFKAKMEALINE